MYKLDYLKDPTAWWQLLLVPAVLLFLDWWWSPLANLVHQHGRLSAGVKVGELPDLLLLGKNKDL